MQERTRQLRTREQYRTQGVFNLHLHLKKYITQAKKKRQESRREIRKWKEKERTQTRRAAQGRAAGFKRVQETGKAGKNTRK